jgi:hypothetical protein
MENWKDAGRVEGSNKRATRATNQGKDKTKKVRPLYIIALLSTKERQEFKETLVSMD